MASFGVRLKEAMRSRGPLCVGIDPSPSLLAAWGLSDDPGGLQRFALGAVEALGGEVAAVKPQSAFFERHGAKGIAVLEQLVAAARGLGALVVLDVKRGDIGSTVQAYADAYLDPGSPLFADAVTATPYLGFGSLDPMLDAALGSDAGVFVVALTSNPEGIQVQQARDRSGTTVAGRVLAQVATRNASVKPIGSIGIVVGATLRRPTEDLAVNGPILAPGLGAQGATAADLPRIFSSAVLPNVLPSASRAVLAAGPDPAHLRAATAALREAVLDATGRNGGR